MQNGNTYVHLYNNYTKALYSASMTTAGQINQVINTQKQILSLQELDSEPQCQLIYAN